MRIKRSITCVLLLSLLSTAAYSQTKPISVQAAATAMTALWHDAAKNEAGAPAKWTYEYGLVLKGLESVWLNTGEGKYFNFIQQGLDRFVNADGTIRTYQIEDYNLDNILTGRALLLVYKVTGQEKYRKAADLLREQLKTHPRTSEGGFWHKKIYPSQMWLDGLYMAEPFYAEYARDFDEPAAFDDVALQFLLTARHLRDPKTGLYWHGWDADHVQIWANKETGVSPNFWGRAVGWYAMALVDVLGILPA